MEQQSDFVL